jgi:hypothetical protein
MPVEGRDLSSRQTLTIAEGGLAAGRSGYAPNIDGPDLAAAKRFYATASVPPVAKSVYSS